MLDLLIKFSLSRRPIVLILALFIICYGLWSAANLSIDVFPDLNRPTVTVLTEAHGLAPEEVESRVTTEIEASMNGIPGVIRIRSSSGIGISVVYVEFDWGTDIRENRQLVSERLQYVQSRLSREFTPILTPISSIMGEIQFVGLSSTNLSLSPMELRGIAENTVRPRLLTLSGISQVIVMGGETKEYIIEASPEKLRKHGMSLTGLKSSIVGMRDFALGGNLDLKGREYLIRMVVSGDVLEQLRNESVGISGGKSVRLSDVADIRVGARKKRGEASVDGKPAVVLTIQKQPGTSTIELTEKIDAALVGLRSGLPEDLTIKSDLFKQSRFIESSIGNVKEALRDGAIIVAIILFLFLLNVRTTAITLISIPVSILTTALVFRWLGMSINTMTLGGIAVAIGEIVDDSIVDVENIFRRLKENAHRSDKKPTLQVVFEASSEIRNSIVVATLIVVLVFVPLFAMSGIEGRLFAPLGIAYIVSIIASLIVSLTLIPVLCSYFLRTHTLESLSSDSPFVRFLKNADRLILAKTLKRPLILLGVCGVLLVASLCLLPLMGREFLPAFNEGTATLSVAAVPGISLTNSNALGTKIEEALHAIPEVKSTIRRTGRAEMDEHAEGVHFSEIDVDFKDGGRERSVVMNEMREKIESIGSVSVNLGQPISHRLDHLLSGVRAQIAIKIFGPEMNVLRKLGDQTVSLLKDMPGLVDLQAEQVVLVPQLKVSISPEKAGEFGTPPGALASELEIALGGEALGSIDENHKAVDLSLRIPAERFSSTESIREIPLLIGKSKSTASIADVADIFEGTGPNMINREDFSRRLIVSANGSERDLSGIVDRVRVRLSEGLKLPDGYSIVYGGQFESEKRATKIITLLGSLSLLAVFLILYFHFRSVPIAFQVMLNVPFALIGSIVAVYLTDRTLSVATLIAFITLCGIASRNGVMMISHYRHLLEVEGEILTEETIIRGSLERLVPVLMTALCAGLALVPLLIAKGEPGKELLYPVAVVIIGGLVSSTLLDILVTPALFLRFGKKAANDWISKRGAK